MTKPLKSRDAPVRFIRIRYLIHQSVTGSRPVVGYAFETPGWPWFHACVRFDRRDTWSRKRWIIDHFESGLALYACELKSRKDAPQAVAKLLHEMGAEKVAKSLEPYIAIPLEPAYSAMGSRKLWDRISALPDGSERELLYAMCCILQDTETRVLSAMNGPHAKAKAGRRTK